MARLIEIGTGPAGPVMLDIDIMLRSGLLVQANSGGGKSWALRVLAEQLCGHVPTFVVDVEGEFPSLRERFPYFLVAKEGGDVVADPALAGVITRKLLELRVSAVFDLFDLDIPDRHRWMAGFLGAMDQAPRDLWGDTAVLIDEAHVFGPEKGKGESVALGGMAAMATRGRKRGFGPVDATQRIGKLNKDIAAELKNALIGLTVLDIDRDRARDALGVGRSERVAYDKALRGLEPGEFFAVGRAFGTLEPVRVKIGPVVSTHPEPGQTNHRAAPPPPAKIRAILAKLGDLPKDTDKRADGDAALRAEITRLSAALAAAKADDGGKRIAETNAYWQTQLVVKDHALDQMRDEARARATEIERLLAPLAALIERHRATSPASWAIGAQPGIVRRDALGVEIKRTGPVTPTGPLTATLTTRPLTVALRTSLPRSARAPITLTKPEGWTMEEEALYQRIVERLRREAPTLLKVLAIKPELDVEVKVRTVQVDGDSLKGRIAGLIANAFFDEVKPGPSVLKELTRLGGNPNSDGKNYMAVLKGFAEIGFLTVEAGGFQAVEGMKVNLKRA